MSLEQSIAALTTQAGLLLDLPQQIANTANGKIAELTALYQARAADRWFTVYVDPINGLDTNLGTVAAPFKTIAKAVDKAQTGSFTQILLTSDVTLTEDVILVNRSICIRPVGSVKLNLSFERFIRADLTPNYASLRRFRVGGSGTLAFFNMNLNVPLNDGAWAAYPKTNETMFGVGDSSTLGGFFTVVLSTCTVTFGASQFGQMCASTFPLAWVEFAMTIAGAADLNGKRFSAVTASGGTASTTLPWLVTNLTNV